MCICIREREEEGERKKQIAHVHVVSIYVWVLAIPVLHYFKFPLACVCQLSCMQICLATKYNESIL